MSAKKHYELLKEYISEYPGAIVAFSGGVDSSLVLAAAADALGDSASAVTWHTEVTPDAEIEAAVVLAENLGVSHRVLSASFLDNKKAASNPPDRCYHCRSQMYGEIKKMAAASGNGTVIMEGVNTDDLSDVRPGIAAAREVGVVHPLVEVGMTKTDVRNAARSIGLPNWDKEASPCLASRVSYGTPITADVLTRIYAAESFLRARGFTHVRLRVIDDIHARIEVAAQQVPAARADFLAINTALCSLGFARAEIDERGYRPGSMNEDATR